MGEFKSFVLGKDVYPEWFKNLNQQHKVEYITDEAGKLLSVKVFTNTGTVRAKVGETLVHTGDSIIKLNKEILAKYAR